MSKTTKRRRRFTIVGALTLSALGAAGLTAPANAATTPAVNHLIIGSGSSTTYSMMTAMDALFDSSLGCYMTQPSTDTQTLNFQCAKDDQGQQVGFGYSENPYNDVALQEPALGSSAGIDQVEDGGTGTDGTTVKTAAVSYARSSRAYKTTDYPGLNFVAYATDGVSWLTFPSVNGKATASAGVTNLSETQLEGIWDGSIKTWQQLPGHKGSGNICVYVAQESSGTESTWATALQFAAGPSALNAYVDGIKTTPAGCKSPSGESYGISHTIFENEGQSIVKNGDEANAIFFFSWGKYQVVCNGQVITGLCADNLANTKPVLGKINGVTADPTTILCTGTCLSPFPVVRDLFNVYANGSFTTAVNKEFGFPAASNATLNYVSEVGFVCKPHTSVKGAKVIDPQTGLSYRTEVTNVITSSGFLPFPLQAHEDENSVDTPAVSILKAQGDTKYILDDPYTGNGAANNEKLLNPPGYCQVWTTDENAAP